MSGFRLWRHMIIDRSTQDRGLGRQRSKIMTKYSILTSIALLTSNAGALPLITQQPNPTTNSVSLGAALTNKVSASSTNLPITYQWRLNGTDISGAITNVLKMN